MFLVTPPPLKNILCAYGKGKKQASVFYITVEEIESRLYNKVAYSRCAPMYGKCRLPSIERYNPHITSL